MVWPGQLTPSTNRYLVSLIFGEAGVSSRTISVTLNGSLGSSGLRPVTSQAEPFQVCKVEVGAVDLGALLSAQVDVEREAIGLEEGGFALFKTQS